MATVKDLYDVDGQAELVGGKIIHLMPTGGIPGLAIGEIIYSLGDYVEPRRLGYVFMAKLAYVVPILSSGRETFSPDASFSAGLRKLTGEFVKGPPTFAVELRNAEEYEDPNSEAARAAKRVDYFEAGTKVVWDVDFMNECIHSFCARDPLRPITFKRGQEADAEPAVPGWRIKVDEIYG